VDRHEVATRIRGPALECVELLNLRNLNCLPLAPSSRDGGQPKDTVCPSRTANTLEYLYRPRLRGEIGDTGLCSLLSHLAAGWREDIGELCDLEVEDGCLQGHLMYCTWETGHRKTGHLAVSYRCFRGIGRQARTADSICCRAEGLSRPSIG
jgi:hypothetical protein